MVWRRLAAFLLLYGSLLLIPAAAWFSIAGVETGLSGLSRLTGTKALAILLAPIAFGAILSEWRNLRRPVPILVGLLGIWTVVANIGRETFASDSLRSAIYFALTAWTAFGATYISARRDPARFRHLFVRLLAAMLIVAVVTGWMERFTLVQNADGTVSDRLEPFWSFFRPTIVTESPVLGPVSVTYVHSYASPVTIRVAGLFATQNALADFLVLAVPMFALTSLAVARRWSIRHRAVAVSFALVLLQAAVWTGSRIGVGVLLMELVGALGLSVALLRLQPSRSLFATGVLGVAVVVSVVLLDPYIRARLTLGDLFPDDEVPAALIAPVDDVTAATMVSNRGHVALQVVAVRLVATDFASVARGPGLLKFVDAINDRSSTYYLGPLIGPGVGGPHSAYLTFALAAGVPGAVLFVGIVALSLTLAIRALDRGRPHPGRVAVAGLTVAFAGWLIVGLVDTNPVLFPDAMLLFAFVGALNGLAER